MRQAHSRLPASTTFRSVSCERIDRHIWEDKRNGGELWRHLRHSGKKYNKRKGKNSGRGLIPGRVDITERPAIVAKKRRIGDWEGDTIIDRSLKGAILTHVDSTSKYTKLAMLAGKSAASVQSLLRSCIGHIRAADPATERRPVRILLEAAVMPRFVHHDQKRALIRS